MPHMTQHSTFLDLIIEGLVGLRASFGNLLTLVPLADASVTHFVLDNLAYHGRNVTVVWDPGATQWPAVDCKGLCVFIDGKIAATSPALQKLVVLL